MITIEEARKYREDAEATILAVLQRLSVVTGLDIAEVKIMMYVDATQDELPQRRVHAVRIDLAV